MKDTIQHEINLSTHLLKNGPRFCTHRLVIHNTVAAFVPTRVSIAYSALYFILGLGLLLIAIVAYEQLHQNDLTLFISGFGVAFIALGLHVSKDYLARIKFDKSNGTFAKKHYRPVLLENIVGLQINQKQQLGYACYELNMLTKGGRRLNILNHNGIDTMRDDMRSLAEFLTIDASHVRDYSNSTHEKVTE